MPSMGVLLLLLLISSIPAIAVFIWFRFARYPFSLPRFSFSLLAGAASLFPALFLQDMLASERWSFSPTGKWGLIAEIFIRIAFTEELSRLLVLIILFFVIRRLSAAKQPDSNPVSAVTMAAAAGLIAGLGFAILESAVYGAANPGNALLRIFTAAPLHGACGFRVGSAVAMFREHRAPAVSRFLSAVGIHGIYNFMLLIPGLFPSIAAVLIALSALASSVMAIRKGMKGEDSP